MLEMAGVRVHLGWVRIKHFEVQMLAIDDTAKRRLSAALQAISQRRFTRARILAEDAAKADDRCSLFANVIRNVVALDEVDAYPGEHEYQRA